ncbi:hypothetical protein CYMTET_38299 [Cymbomonas tetramitiformis]|uniref:Uncharacterized protein n=1 Tax=Cymbomonas tetramitiformis TaxID=36881 RepID=A0AAE0F5M1_9CHLO|nr:hypothetical protein CYMTET_38299 [Cymbomonas tetramitiformis]
MVSGQPFCGYKHWSKTMPFTNPKLAQPVYQEIYGTDAGDYKLVAKKLASITKDGFMQTKTVEKIRKRRSGAANESVTKSREETMRLLKLAEESEKKFAAENALADQTLHTTLTQSSFASTPPQYKPLLLEGNVEEIGEKLSGMKVDNNKATDITNELEALRDQSDVQLGDGAAAVAAAADAAAVAAACGAAAVAAACGAAAVAAAVAPTSGPGEAADAIPAWAKAAAPCANCIFKAWILT